jgi:hypothetical protein
MKAEADSSLVSLIEALLKRPVYFRELPNATREKSYRDALKAWSAARYSHHRLAYTRWAMTAAW